MAGRHSVAGQTVPSQLVDLGCTGIGCREVKLAFFSVIDSIHAGLCQLHNAAADTPAAPDLTWSTALHCDTNTWHVLVSESEKARYHP